MPKSLPSARPDRKLTDFFSKKPKTGPRPGQPVYEVSSSSELQSIISVSSDDVSVSVVGSGQQQQQRTRGQEGIRRSSPRLRADSRRQPTTASSKLSETHTAPISDLKPLARGASGAAPQSQCAPVVPLTPKKNAKKRKQQLINLISSEESDGPVYPSIHAVRLSPKKHDRKSTPTTTVVPPPIVPLTPRQNILGHSKCSSPNKADIISSKTLSAAAKPSVHMRNGGSPYSQPSPSKRARRESVLSDRLKPCGPGFDADDESEDQMDATHKNLGRRVSSPVNAAQPFEINHESLGRRDSPSIDFAQPFEANDEDFVNDEMQIDTVPFLSPVGARDGVQRADEQNESDALMRRLEIVPSSQMDETELLMDCAPIAVEPPALPDVSPSKARTEDIIARIRAKAEADAAAQAEDDRKRSSLGLLGSDKSDLSSLSSLSDDEGEDELELELGTFVAKGRVVKRADAALHVPSPTSPKPWTRRSTRHLDGPAPNYAKKLELFRADTPPPPINGPLKIKPAMPEACPLDMLLKDRQREWTRKARMETRRKGDVGADMMDPSGFETPTKRGDCQHARTESPGSCVSSSPCDGDSQDVLMGTAAREELLGKEGSEAVGKILDEDRKRKRGVDQRSVDVSFWCDDVEGESDVVPRFVITDQSHPFLTVLDNAIKREEYGLASLLVDSGAFASVPLSTELLDWLFSTALLSANPDLSLSAYRALLVLHRDVYSTEVMPRAQLGAEKLLFGLFKLGVDSRVARMLGIGIGEVPTVAMSQSMKRERVFRFLAMLEALSRSQSVDPMAIPSLVSALLLLSLDPSAVPELQQDAVSAIEAVLASPNVTRNIELDTCTFVLRVTKELELQAELEVRMLALLPGCSPSSGRVRRWIAWAMLGGDLQGRLECADVPPIHTLVNLFAKSVPGDVKFEVTPDTDYEQLGARVNILSVAMTDVEGYVRLGSGGAMINVLCEALDQINGKIVDTRAAHMDRTRTKEAINRLQKRLVYQRHATIESMRTQTGRMEQFLVPRSRLHRGHN